MENVLLGTQNTRQTQLAKKNMAHYFRQPVFIKPVIVVNIQHQKTLSSTHPSVPPPQFHIKNPSGPLPSVSYQKLLRSIPLSFTSKNPQFNKNKNSSVQVFGWESFWLREFWCWNEGKWNWGVFGVEQRDFGCWKSVDLVWNRCVELRGTWDQRIYSNKDLQKIIIKSLSENFSEIRIRNFINILC